LWGIINRIKSSPLRHVLNIVISIVILLLLFSQVPIRQVSSILSKYHPLPLMVALGAVFFSIAFDTWRWQILLRGLGYHYRFLLLYRLKIMTFFFNVYVPGGVGGDLVRIALVPGEDTSAVGSSRSGIAASVVTDRIVGLIGLMLLALIGFFCSFRLLVSANILPVFLLLAAGIVAAVFVLFSNRTHNILRVLFAVPLKWVKPVRNVLGGVRESLSIYRANYGIFGRALPICILGHFLVVCVFAAIALALEVEVSFFKLLMIVPLIEFVSALPISLGGAGVREFATITLLAPEGVGSAEAMSISLTFFAVIMVVGAIGGILFIFRRALLR